jgi:hypothetical protein
MNGSITLPLRLAALLLCSVSAWGRGLLVTPVQVGLSGAAGSTVTDIVSVSSARPEETQIRTSIADFRRTLDGVVEVVPPEQAKRSCRTWIEVDQREFVSPKSGVIPVVVTAHIPSGASGSYWALLQLDAVPPPQTFARQPTPHVGVQVIPRVASPVVVTVAGNGTTAIVSREIHGERGAEKIEAFEIIDNTGTNAVLVSGAFALERRTATGDTEELASVDVGPMTSLPGSPLRIRASIPWTADVGNAEVHAYLRFGSGSGDVLEARTAVGSHR